MVVVAWRWVCRLARGHRPAAVLTFAAATVASVDAATGMWRFFGTVLHFDVLTRAPIFAFLEIAVVTFALRARDRLLQTAARAKEGSGETPSRGINGVLMWMVTALSAVLSAMASRSPAEAAFRLATPLVAALLWERGLSAEYQREVGRTYHWRLRMDRILVWLGLAEPTARDIGQVAIHRRIDQAAVAIDRARRASMPVWRGFTMFRARARLRLAELHTGLADDEDLKDLLVQKVAILGSTSELVGLAVPPTWRVQKPGDRRPRRQGGGGEQPPGGGGGEQPPGGAARGEYARLAEDLAEAIPAAVSGDVTAAQRMHALLASRTDYEEFCRWLAGNGGPKRMMAAAALYAGGDIKARAGVQKWIAGLVPGQAGRPDKAEILRIAQALEPVWTAEGYPGDRSAISPTSEAVPS